MIRTATLQDFGQIQAIKEKVGLYRDKLSDSRYKQKIEQDGFLLYPTISFEEYKEYVKESFFVYEEGNVIQGYIHISGQQEMKKESPMKWEKDLSEIYFLHPHAALYGIAVDPLLSGKGIATQLLEEAQKNIDSRIQYLFSFVVSSPVKNIASINWHKKNGFERLGFVSYERKNELHNFQSILYVKKLF